MSNATTTRSHEHEAIRANNNTECGYCGQSFSHGDPSVTVGVADYAEYEEGEFVMGWTIDEEPYVEVWHEQCARSHGVDLQGNLTTRDYYSRRVEPWVNVRTVVAFFVGVIIMLLLASFLVV